MKVQEALAIFGMGMKPEQRWMYKDGKYGYHPTGRDTIDLDWVDSLSQDRRLLMNNLQSEVEYLKHVGMVGLLAFKMNNGQMTLFGFNNPLDWRSINRDDPVKQMQKYESFVKLSKQEHHDIDTEEVELWLSLKAIGGK